MSLLSGATSPPPDPTAELRFGGLLLERSAETLEPRSWTVAQSRWGARLAATAEEGPVLELYAGGGQIGLELVRLTGREIVQVDASADACLLARRNADRNGLGHLVTIRHRPVRVAPRGSRTYPLVLADPPYVPTGEVSRHAGDPQPAIDGGPDGMDHLRDLVRVLPGYLRPTTPVLVQVRGAGQAEELQDVVLDLEAPLRIDEVRSHGADRAIVLLRPR